jgi:hypothetical protein
VSPYLRYTVTLLHRDTVKEKREKRKKRKEKREKRKKKREKRKKEYENGDIRKDYLEILSSFPIVDQQNQYYHTVEDLVGRILIVAPPNIGFPIQPEILGQSPETEETPSWTSFRLPPKYSTGLNRQLAPFEI